MAALARNETTPGLLATSGGTALETLTRLWLLQAPVPLAAAEAALPDLVDRLCAEGILERSVSEVAARVDVRPYGDGDEDLWIVADLTPGLDGGPQRVRPDYVLGISPAATSLAEQAVRRPAARALDLGTGCGVQALHLAAHCEEIVATDVNARALRLTRLNAALNGKDGIDVRDGSFFAPVAGERFDLIVTNPPFVISPATGERLVYRDSGLPGDRAVEDIVRQAREHLTDGGLCQVLANWVILRDQPWEERLAGWCEGVDAWVVQRERVDLPTYVEMWLKDAGHHPGTGEITQSDYQRRYSTWLTWLEEQGVEGIGFGWINLRRTDAEPVVRCEEWPYEVAQPIGIEIGEYFDRVEWLRQHPDLDGEHLVRRTDVIQETSGPPGAEDPAAVILRQQVGLRRARQVSTAEAAFVGACDGDLSLGQLSEAVAQIVGAGIEPGIIRELVAEGFLT
ncbi:MAG: methyltransferase domain-containing protein, partial [Myxococcales bacterium]